MVQAVRNSGSIRIGVVGVGTMGSNHARVLAARRANGNPVTKLINVHNRSVAEPSRALPHARMHDLRHLHATTLLLAGVPVHIVAARLGHADPAVTLRVYSHVLREHALGVGDIFAQAVEAPVSNPLASPARRAGEIAIYAGQLVVRGRVELPTFRFSGEI